MGLGLRVFIVEKGGLTRVPSSRMQRLLDGHRGERLKEFANHTVRCALVHVEVVSRRPISIRRMSYPLLSLDRHGRVDRKELLRAQRLAVEFATRGVFDTQDAVAQFGPYAAGRRFKAEFTWVPTQAEVDLLVKAVLGGKPA